MNQNEMRAVHDGKRTFLFLSSCYEPWGGSEELWSSAAKRLACAGHRVHVIKMVVDRTHKRIKELTDVGITFDDYWRIPVPKPTRIARSVLPARFYSRFPDAKRLFLAKTISRLRPDLTVISQGENFDGLEYIERCRQFNVPYAVICQKASDQHWPSEKERQTMHDTFTISKRNYFVSDHNRVLTELQIGVRLPNSEVVRNPFMTPVTEPLPWPESPDGRLRMACVARMFVLEKGQDLLINVMSQDKWKARPLDVTFYGAGIHSKALEEMAALLDVHNLRFAGFSWDVTEIWRTHHALVLPSRAEGLPLTLVEAMLCGRPAVITDIGGNAELIDDNETGFVARGASVHELDAAMERAWQRRADWEEIGRLAESRTRACIPEDPGGVFTAKLLQLCG
jgi:glycosyltransferase involved in cell wall biosynthesis